MTLTCWRLKDLCGRAVVRKVTCMNLQSARVYISSSSNPSRVVLVPDHSSGYPKKMVQRGLTLNVQRWLTSMICFSLFLYGLAIHRALFFCLSQLCCRGRLDNAIRIRGFRHLKRAPCTEETKAQDEVC